MQNATIIREKSALFLVVPYEPGGTPSPQSSFSDFKENPVVMHLELKNEVKYMPIYNDGCKDFF